MSSGGGGCYIRPDVLLDASIPHIRITPDAGSVKTRQFRDVPIHPELLGADSDEAGQAFQYEAGHRFRFEAGQGSDLKPAT